jgi:diguanylate cyclase (GGDEF)-like protein
VDLLEGDHTANLGDTFENGLEQDAAPRDRACLLTLTGPGAGETYPIGEAGMLVGRLGFADLHVYDEGVSRKHAFVRRQGDQCLLEDLGSRNGTYCNGGRIHSHALREGDKIRVGRNTVFKFTYLDELDESFMRQMRDSALRDGLTRIFNKMHLLERLEGEYSFAVRHGAPLSVMMLDLDHFKVINDTHGHVAGDAVLVSLTACVAEQLRSEDVFGRYGGEEFVVVCRATLPSEAGVIADRLRDTIERLDVTHRDKAIRCTASFGVAGLPVVPADTPHDLIQAADKALYAAKASGRNRVVVAASA